MFIQITKDKYIRQKNIIGVFDLDTSTVSGITKNFLSGFEKNSKDKIVGTTTLPKSFVLTDDKIYFSAGMTGHIEKSGKSGKSKTLFFNRLK